MQKLIVMLSICLMGTAVLVAESCGNRCAGWPSFSPCEHSPWPSSFNIDVGGGFRKDKFKWSKGGQAVANPDGSLPPYGIRSNLNWKDLRIAQFGGTAEYVSCRNYAVRIEASYGRIYHGKNIDSDYFVIDDESTKFAVAESKAGKGHVYDLSAAVGYRITSTCRRFVATPLIGYSQYAQYLHMYDGSMRLDLSENKLGPFPGLNSTYTTRWFGPWIGLDFTTRVERCAYLFGSFQWHMLTYRGHGRWNLRHDIGPFNHKAYGYGYLATLGGKWEIWNNWSLGIVGSYRMFRTKHGHVRVKLLPEDVLGYERFNGAIWHSFSASAIVAWRF